jgi:hypothetical protein
MPPKFYDLTVPPKFIRDIYSYFRALRIKFYKRKKIRRAKTPFEKDYYISFKIGIDDVNNPTELQDFNIVIPAKAAFFAKKKLEKHILNNIVVEVLTVNEIEEDDNEERFK